MTSAGAGGFAKGFASGFVTTFTARQQQEHEKEQLTLKSRLDALREDAEARKKKQETEQKALDQGAQFSTMVGDKEFAPYAANWFRMGGTMEGLKESWDKGEFPKTKRTSTEVEMPSDDLKAPNIKVPAGVMPMPVGEQVPVVEDPSGTSLPPIDSVSDPSVAVPAVQNVQKTNTIDPAVAAQNLPATPVEQGDTPVLQEVQQPDKEKIFSDNKGPYSYNPSMKKQKLGSLADEVYQMEEARRSGDTLLYAQQERKVEAIKKAEFIKANQVAKLKGDNLINYALIDKNGKLVTFIPTERDANDNLVNASTENNGQKNPITVGPDQQLVRVSDDQIKQTWNIQEQFAKQSKDYKISAISTAEAVSYTRKMTEILDRNPSVTTDTQGIMVFAQGMFEEAKAIQKVFEQSTMNASENLKEGGDPNAVSAALATMDQKMKDLELQKLNLSDRNAQDALDKTLFDNYKVLAAYKLAQANGQSGQAAGEKDIQRFLALVGDKNKKSTAVKAILANQLKEQVAKNDNMMNSLNRDIEQWGPGLGFIPNVSADNLTSLIKDKADREYFMQILKMKDEAQLGTQMKANEADGVQTQPVQTQEELPVMNSVEDAMKLPSGTKFKTPDGRTKIRP